jgi:hypothetical protein
MLEHTGADLEKLGRRLAQAIAGDDAVEAVEVESGADILDRPAYHFSFLIDQGRSKTRVGLLHIRLANHLLDELTALGDEHRPLVRILDRDGWSKRAIGRPL